MWTAAFWKDAVERAVKTAAQTAVGLFAALNVAGDVDWAAWAIGLGVAVVLSFVTSLASSLAGNNTSASLVDGGGVGK
jgi:hypothetical protein